MSGLRARKKDRNRQQILAAAMSLFGKRGFRATTTEQIAAAAEVAAGTLYNYFGTKGAIVVALFGDATARLLEAGRAVVARPGRGPAQAVLRLFQIYLGLVDTFGRELLGEVFAAMLLDPEESVEALAGMDQQLIAQVAELLAVLQARGDVAAGVTPLDGALQLYAIFGVQLLMHMHLPGYDRAALEAGLKSQVALAFSGLAPREKVSERAQKHHRSGR
jgi:AcrR family transcriptional regulator